MQKSEPLTVIKNSEKEVLTHLPTTISRKIKSHLEALMEPFSVSPGLNAKIKRIFNKPQ